MSRALSLTIRSRFKQFLRGWVARCQSRHRRHAAEMAVSEALERRVLLSVVALDDDGEVFPNDPDLDWSLHNTGQTGGSFDADIDMPAAWSVTTGSTSTVVAVLGTGVEYTHPDLYLNMWLNQDEIPDSIAASLTDSDGDGLFTFRDLNDASNSGHVTDLNGTGFIDGGDLLADASWADGLDTDGNGFTDDLVGWDFIDNDNDPLPAGGTGGHETGIAKNIGAIGDNGFEGAGVNWQIQMMPVRTGLHPIVENFDAPIAGLNYAVAEDVPISANAWGNFEGFDQGMYDAIDAARLNDHLFIAAAGNRGTDNDGPVPGYPASFDLDNIVSVAGVFDNDVLSTNFGLTSVDLAGPGPGTSRGSSHTAGVAALIHSLHPEWTFSQIKDRILSSVDPLPSLAGKTVTGGRLNAAAALAESSIHISDPSIVEGDAGSTDLVFTVTRRGDVSQGVTIDWATADGTAQAGSDYVAAANTLVFLADESSKTITVNVNTDLLDEGPETLFVNLTNPSGGLLADVAGQGTIVDDDAQIAIDDVSVTEGDDSVQFTGVFVPSESGGLGSANAMTIGPDGNLYAISLGGTRSHAVLRYDGETGEFLDVFVSPLSGGLSSPRDLSFQNGHLYVTSFGTNEVLRYDATTGEFVDAFVTAGSGGLVNPDGLTFGPEGDLYVVGNQSHNVLRYDGTTGEFIDDFVSAGSGGLNNPFRLTFGPDGNLYVGSAGTQKILRFDGTTGEFIDDFVSAGSGGIGTTHTLIFRDGHLYATTTDIDAVVRFDAITGAFIDEFIPSGSNGLQNPRGMVFDADGNLFVENSVNFEIHRYGTTPMAVFTVSLSNASLLPVTVDWTTAAGFAVAGDDYTAVSRTMTFDPGVTQRTIIIPILDDDAAECEETFFVNLSNASGGSIVDAQGQVTITDDDTNPVFPGDPLFSDQWQLHNTGQTGGLDDADMDLPEAWAVTTGSMSTVVAVNDSGVDYTHENLYLNIWINEGEIPAAIASSLNDFDADGVISFRDLNDASNAAFVTDLNGTGYIDTGDLLADPAWEDGIDTDGNGFVDDIVGWDFIDGDNDPHAVGLTATWAHGTKHAGGIGAIGDNNIGITGINWRVSMMPLRMKLGGQEWTIEDAVAAIDYAVSMGAPISSNGYGNNGPASEQFSQDFYDAIDRARLAGHLVVGASGGGSLDLDVTPNGWSRYDLDNIIVGNGLDYHDQLGPNHNWSLTAVDVSVPTVGTWHTDLNNQYGTWSAASASVALMGGVAALVHSAHPNWSYAEIKAQIMSTVDPVPGLAGLTVTGGRVNAAAAVGVVAPTLMGSQVNQSGSTNRSGIGTLSLGFNQPVRVTDATSLVLINHTTGESIDLSAAMLASNFQASITWDLTGVTLPDGRYSAVLPAGSAVNACGLTSPLTHVIQFHVLAGDIDGDGNVNFNDTVPLSLNFGATGVAPYSDGDADGDGNVNFNDTVPLSLNFGASLPPLTYDYGDAPEMDTSYPTRLAKNGPRHAIMGNMLFLGAGRDNEVDGQPNAAATGDGADDDGTNVDMLDAGSNANIPITSSGSGFVNAWIDFNADGDWDDPGEHVLVDQPVVAGVNDLQVDVPFEAAIGTTFARFRLTGTSGYSYFGSAPDGEVEDYLITINPGEDPEPDPDFEVFTEVAPEEDWQDATTALSPFVSSGFRFGASISSSTEDAAVEDMRLVSTEPDAMSLFGLVLEDEPDDEFTV